MGDANRCSNYLITDTDEERTLTGYREAHNCDGYCVVTKGTETHGGTCMAKFPYPELPVDKTDEPTQMPTQMKTTMKPTNMPTTGEPTQMKTTMKPTNMPNTGKPTQMKTT